MNAFVSAILSHEIAAALAVPLLMSTGIAFRMLTEAGSRLIERRLLGQGEAR